MKACIYTQYGPPEVVHVQECDKPVFGAGEVLIKVYATTVNRTDTGFRSAEYFISRLFSGLFRPKHTVLGNEFAGIVEAVGKDVSSFRPGDCVFGYNDVSFGAHAEYMIMPEKGAMAIMPANLTFEEAAPLCEGAHYALCDIRAAGIQAGQQVLIHGATGAIGSAAVQLANYYGARVTAICATPNLELVKQLGADEVIDYLNSDFTQTTNRFDFIFDAAGKTSYGVCKPLLREKGIYISTEPGKYGENIFRALIRPFCSGKKVLFPIPTAKKEDILFLKALAETGKYKPVIDRYYTLTQIVEAHSYVETGQKTGNVVIVATR